MDTIELWSGETKALIDPVGAWLTNLSDDKGDVLFPKRLLMASDGSKKQRGGMHVCLPNFGPGGDSGLAQHGFGREVIWQPVEVQPDRAVFELANGKDGYETLHSTLLFALDGRSIDVVLKLENRGDEPLRVAPGFHPYVALGRGENSVRLNDEPYGMAELAGTEFFDDSVSMHLKTLHRSIAISSHQLPTWAFWTDKLDDYVCVEPTVGGNTFLASITDREELIPGKMRNYSITIAW